MINVPKVYTLNIVTSNVNVHRFPALPCLASVVELQLQFFVEVEACTLKPSDSVAWSGLPLRRRLRHNLTRVEINVVLLASDAHFAFSRQPTVMTPSTPVINCVTITNFHTFLGFRSSLMMTTSSTLG